MMIHISFFLLVDSFKTHVITGHPSTLALNRRPHPIRTRQICKSGQGPTIQ